jgi:crotonobetainyl-CoA:carnitine CoA-transferase CaiB-like acyl-CoA transferase
MVTLRPMEGVRILEVAQFTYTPSAGAVLADWGADVIKVEHAVTGDAQRGMRGLSGWKEDNYHPIIEHPNRGKRSIGLALEEPSALEVLHELVRTSDVFLTNFLPDARTRLKIEVDDIRAVNPDIIYVRGSAFGVRGDEATRGGYDATAYWARCGHAAGVRPPDYHGVLGMPAPAYGDSLGGMTIAGGISAALFARERTGEPSVLDVSLLSVGLWANALAVDISLANGEPWPGGALGNPPEAQTNPCAGPFETSDGRFVYLAMMQPGRYWADFCRHLGREDMIDDERWNTGEKLIENAPSAAKIVHEVIKSKPFSHWVETFRTLEGQWAPVQDSLELGYDPQVRANQMISEIVDADGRTRELVTSPVQWDETPLQLTRAPQFAEHTDEILHELGHSDEQIIDLKIEGAAT